MKIIRRGTFETNSSSTHSIVISTKKDKEDIYLSTFILRPDEYGWGVDKHDFASYLWTAILEISDYYGEEHHYEDNWCKKVYEVYTKDEWKDKIREVLSPYCKNIIFYEPEKETCIGDYVYYTNCSIDHVSELVELLEILYNDEELLFNSLINGKVYTGNDNDDLLHDMYGEEIREYKDDKDNYFTYYKGN